MTRSARKNPFSPSELGNSALPGCFGQISPLGGPTSAHSALPSQVPCLIFRSSRSLLLWPFQHFPVTTPGQPDSTSQSQNALQTALPCQNADFLTKRLDVGVSPRSRAAPPSRLNSTDSTFRSRVFLIEAYLLGNKLGPKTPTALPGQLATYRSLRKTKKNSTSQSNEPIRPLNRHFLPHLACGLGSFHRTSQSAKPHLPVTYAALPRCNHGTSRSTIQHFPVLLNIEARCSSS